MRIHHIWIILVTFTTTTTSQPPDPQPEYAGGRCSQSESIATNSTYHTNILTVLSSLHSLSSANHFFTTSSGFGPDQVNGYYLCRPDLSLTTCHDCVNATINTFRQFCFNRTQTILWYQECMLRYTNNSIAPFSNETEPSYSNNANIDVSSPVIFPALVNTTMERLISRAVSSTNTPRFFAYEEANFTAFEGFYGMVFCRPDMSPEECENCLTIAMSRIPGESLSLWAMVLLPNCQLRYDTAPFIFPSQQPVLPPAPS